MHTQPAGAALGGRASLGVRADAILLPGFLDSTEYSALRTLAAALPAAGIAAVGLDPPTSASGVGAATYTTSRFLVEVAAALDGVAGSRRTVLVGHCYGALLACLAAADPRVTDVVALMPTRCFIWPEDYDARKDTWRDAGERSFRRETPDGVRTFRLAHSLVEDALTHDLPAHLRGLRQRILFVAGALDEVIPPAAVRMLYDECGSADKEIAVLPGVQHDYRDHAEQLAAVNSSVLEWLGPG